MNSIIGDVLDHLQPVNNSLLTELLVLKISQLLNTLYTIEILYPMEPYHMSHHDTIVYTVTSIIELLNYLVHSLDQSNVGFGSCTPVDSCLCLYIIAVILMLPTLLGNLSIKV